jgi:putative ABC transport system permease protein
MILSDIRYALRMMWKTPLFTVVVVLTVGLAIAANTAIFSIMNAVLLRPLPFASPNRLVQVAEKNDKLNLKTFASSVLNFLSWREQTQTLEEMAAVGYGTFTLNSGAGEPEQLSGNRISPALMHVLGLDPVAGRTFTEAEEKPGAPAVAMIGEGFWKRRFGGDSSVVGRIVTINGAPTTIIGIAPAALYLLSSGELYTPLTLDPAKELRLNHLIFTVGRLKNGVSIQQAQAEMDTIAARVGRQYPEVRDWGIHLVTFSDSFVSAELKTGLLVLMGAVGCVLLIACANIANMLLSRAAARQKEMAVRTAIGASRRRLLRQMLAESIALSAGGGVAGAGVAIWSVRMIKQTLPPNLLPVPDVHVDATALLFALILTVITGLLFGIVPAWRITKADLNDVLKQAGRGSTGGMRSHFRNTLAAAELAFATILLIGAGLLVQSFMHLQRVRVGFEPRGLITFQLAPPMAKYPINTKAPLFYRALLDSLQSLPGVKGVGVSSGIPFGAGNYTRTPMFSRDASVLPPDAAVPIDWRIVSPGFFKTMSIPMLRGRDFTDADGPGTQLTVVDRDTARRFWGDADPIGRGIGRVADGKIYTVIGVVGEVRDLALNEDSPSVYYPMAERVWPLMDIVIRTDNAPEALMPSVRQKVHELDAELALANVKTMDEWLANTAASPRLNTVLLSLFAGVALLIAAIGIYGVLAYSVNQRTQEIGVRMALGAQPGGVLRLIIGEGMRIGLIGTAIGLAGGFGLGHVLSSLVYGVSVHDVTTFAVVSIVLMIVTLAACTIPARRAARVDPLVALRHD